MVQESGLVCRVCGTVNDKKAKFCNECGNKLKQEKACPVFEKNKEEQGITDKRFGSGLMADDFKFGEEIDEKQKVFGSSINRDEINIITFSDKMDEVFDGAWDVSSNRNGSVMAYIREICGLTELVIAGKNGICANENCSQLFAEYENLLQINFNGVFDTSRVTNMHSMFNGCYRLKNLNVSKFDTNRVTDMSWMFVDCEQIDQLDLSGFDTSQVTNMAPAISAAMTRGNLMRRTISRAVSLPLLNIARKTSLNERVPLPTKTLTTKNKKTSARSIRIIAIFFALATLYCSLTESVFSFFLFISIKLCKKNSSLSNNIFGFVRII